MSKPETSKPNCYQILDEAVARCSNYDKEVVSIFKKLTNKQLTWRPSPEKWSVMETVEHITKSNQSYLPQLASSFAKTVPNQAKNYGQYRPGFFGNFLFGMVNPDTRKTKKAKAPSIFRPANNTNANPESILKDHTEVHKKIMDYMEKGKSVNMQAVRVKSGAIPLISFHLADLFRVFGAHEARHLMQIKEVMAHPQFPAN